MNRFVVALTMLAAGACVVFSLGDVVRIAGVNISIGSILLLSNALLFAVGYRFGFTRGRSASRLRFK